MAKKPIKGGKVSGKAVQEAQVQMAIAALKKAGGKK